jgi:organic radical activating enzyme
MGEYNELALTGGEPLLYADFLKAFLGLYKKISPGEVYLETNGILHAELEDIKPNIDVVSMDIKLPSSSPGQRGYFTEHADFIRACAGKKTVIKMVITSDTKIDDIKKAADVIGRAEPATEIFLQPVSVCNEKTGPPDGEMLDYFKGYLSKNTDKNIAVTGQFHKLLGIR